MQKVRCTTPFNTHFILECIPKIIRHMLHVSLNMIKWIKQKAVEHIKYALVCYFLLLCDSRLKCEMPLFGFPSSPV